MRQLVIDLGNTVHKTAIFDEGQVTRISYFTPLTPPNLKELFAEFPGISHAILSSVIHHQKELETWLLERLNLLILDSSTPLPILMTYKTPESLGKDRLAAAIGGNSLYPDDPVLVVNMGTCVTYDFIDRQKTYHGGAISPGLTMRYKALNTFTGKLPLIEHRDIDFFIGQTTEESILSGVINGMTAEVEGVIQRYLDKYPDLKVILSGGDLNNFVNRLKISTFAHPNIVITGLQKILDFNVSTNC